ncbi:MAG: acyltransferase domain-containing protein, partial [Actinoallomurus sp.]
EIAAAQVAGVLSLGDAAELVAARGALMGALPPGGAMVAVRAAEDEVSGLLRDGVAIAAVNGPAATVISGPEDAVAEVTSALDARGVRTRRLRVSHAFHSPLMEPMLKEFRRVAASLSYAPPRVPVISNVTGEPAGDALRDPEYWVEHVRRPVRFADGMAALAGAGMTAFAELGPDGSLCALAADTLTGDVTLLRAMRRDRPEPETFLRGLATGHVHGVRVDWTTALPGAHRRVELPTYAFQHRRYWLDAPPLAADMAAAGLDAAGHPLLGATMTGPDGSVILTGLLRPGVPSWLADHRVSGTPILPGAAFVELALHAAAETGSGHLAELVTEAPLPLTTARRLRCSAGPADEMGTRALEIHSAPDEPGAEWTRHATGVLGETTGSVVDERPAGEAEARPTVGSVADERPVGEAEIRPPVGSAADERSTGEANVWPPAGAEPAAVDEVYAELAGAGLDYGPALTGLRAAWRRDGEVFAEVALDERQSGEAGRYGVHPALLDAALHGAALLATDGVPRVPFTWTGVTPRARGAVTARVHLTATGTGTVAVRLFTESGAPILTVSGLSLRAVEAPRPSGDTLYRLDWTPVPAEAPATEHGWAVLGATDALTGGLARAGARSTRHADLAALT